MKIDGPGSVRPATTRRTRGGDTSGAFSDALGGASAGATSGAHSAQSSQAMGSMDALLALQGIDEDDESLRRRRSVRRAETILDRLETLKVRLLAGGIPASALRDIVNGLQADRDSISDPKLAGVLDEIDLRARVELAKLGIDPFDG